MPESGGVSLRGAAVGEEGVVVDEVVEGVLAAVEVVLAGGRDVEEALA